MQSAQFTHSLIIKVTLSFPEFVQAGKKPGRFINSFLRYNFGSHDLEILESHAHDLKDHDHFLPHPTNNY